MIQPLPNSTKDFKNWTWSQIEPYFQKLDSDNVTNENLPDWLTEWTHLYHLLDETFQRLYVATSIDTADEKAEQRFNRFLDEIYPNIQTYEQKLKRKLLDSKLEPDNFKIPLRNIRTEIELYRDENLPLLSQEQKLCAEYDKIVSAQAVQWEGEEITLTQLKPVYQDTDRERREGAWRLSAKRQLEDRQAINSLWFKFLDLRLELSSNAGCSDYRSFRWKQLLRFDYSPEDCRTFHRAIEKFVVPAASRILEKRRKNLGVPSLRPWDTFVDPLSRQALKPFKNVSELIEKTANIFNQVDSKLGEYFKIMRREGLLDLDNRKGKAPGGYCTEFMIAKHPFIFMNAVGIQDDVGTLLHEGGHSFHVFESCHLPYHQQLKVPMEFAEVASMGMELLSSPYLSGDGSFYSSEEAARARIEHLEGIILFWPYMAVVDAFQHWVYENPDSAALSSNCDNKWAQLWHRFMPGVDWAGLEQEMMTGWHRKLHIHQVPFYYIEYGLAQLGAVQIWRNSLKNQSAAVSAYREALSLGATVSLPELFTSAGAEFAFGEDSVSQAVDLLENKIEELKSL